MENKQFDDLNDDFVESIKAKLNRREKADNSQFYTEDEVKDYWIYPLYSLTGNNIKNGIKASTNKITICATQIELGQKISGYLTQNNVFSLNELADPTNPSESILKNTVSLVFSTQNDEQQFDTDYLYLLTKEVITTENFENIEKFVNQEMEIPNIENNNDSTSFIFREIKDLTSSYKISPIKIILSKPFTNKITELSFTSPNGCYVGNLKLKNKQGKVPNLIAKDGTVLFPKLVFPWQLEPNISMTDFWNGNQIIPLKDIFTFLDSKGIKYNQEFSLQDFLQLGGSQPPSSIQIAKAKRIKFNAVYDGNDQVPAFDSGTGTAYYQKNPFTSRNKVFELNLDQVTIFPNSDFSNSDSTAKSLYQSIASYGLVPYQETTKLNSIINLEIIPDGATPSSDAFELLKTMLTYGYWKDREFEHAVKLIKNDNQWVEVIDNEKIYKIRTLFEGQDRYAVVTNLWIAWKKRNPTVVLENKSMVNRIENALAMLSSNLKSNYCINKGDNDDYKILLPYYFEVTNPRKSRCNWLLWI
ncbi:MULTISPECIES: hypothetical protein [unclassified Spiroplasma]|uniref:hypothetical protein n=1 Tax=unclassified Spiroplasma TaxID=2637901 RepID=UPI0030D1B43E